MECVKQTSKTCNHIFHCDGIAIFHFHLNYIILCANSEWQQTSHKFLLATIRIAAIEWEMVNAIIKMLLLRIPILSLFKPDGISKIANEKEI